LVGRLEEALETMQRAHEVLGRLAQENPNVLQFQSQKASAEIYSASLLNKMGRRGEALHAYERALASLERLSQKSGSDHYNIACAHACLAPLITAAPGTSQSRHEQAARHLDQAMAALRQSLETGYRLRDAMTDDPDVEPLRSRADFQRLMMDLVFPVDAFAR
jgi:tetratricopeptide (TPR) repeat protein